MFGLKKLERRIQGMVLIVLAGGLGVGGVVYRDNPIVKRLLGDAKQELNLKGVDAEGLKNEVKAVASKLVQAVEGEARVDRGPGRYEVKVVKVSLDDIEFRAGRTVDLQAVLVRHDAKGGKDKTLWESKHSGERLGVAGRGPITASWSDRPFDVDWTPGDEYTLELWDHRGLRPTKRFALELDDDGDFPLRSKTHRLETLADGRPVHDPSANTVVIESRRIAVAGPAPSPAIAKTQGERRGTRR